MAHAAFHWQDPFLLQQQLSEDERLVQAFPNNMVDPD